MVIKLRTPFYKDPTKSSRTIVAEHDANAGVTYINTDCDVVTLGIAAAVLSKQFEEEIDRYDLLTQEDIKRTIQEAVDGRG